MISTVPTSSLRRPIIGRTFGITLAASLGLHLVVLVGYAIFDARRMAVIELPEEPIKATLVRLGKPRPEKLLPRLTTAPKPNAPPSHKAVPAKDAKSATVEDAREDVKMQSALERIREQVERDEAREAALNRIADRVGKADDEPEGQEDGSPLGDSPTASQVNQYLASLHAAVKQQFVVPSVIQPQECIRLVATVMVRMGPDGTVQEAKVHQGSSSELFDSAVVQAVKSASPLPKPPPNMHGLVSNGFGFKFRCAS